MKIGIVCPYNIFKGGGVQECVIAIQSELTRRGYDAYIITPRPRDYPGKAPDGMILVGSGTDIKSPFQTTAQVSVSVEPDELEHMLQEHKFDLLHFHEPWVPIVSRQILLRSNAANVATFHAKLPETVMSKTIERVITPYTKSVLKNLDEITAVSTAAAEYVSKLDTRKPSIIPNGIDVSKYSIKGEHKNSKKKSILYIGRLEHRKGVKYLLKAFGLLAAQNEAIELTIAGEGTDRQKLEQYVRDNKIPRVTFKGFVTDDEKLVLLGQADVFCSPALYGESFGIVLLEALASGCMIVAGDNPGYRAVMQGLGKLSLVNPKYSSEFARRLDIMLDDTELRTVWRQWAKDYVAQFDYKRVVDQYEQAYKRAQAHKKH